MKNSFLTKLLGAATLLLLSGGLQGQTWKWRKPAVASSGNQNINDVASDGKGNSYVVGDFTGSDAAFDPDYFNVDYSNTDGTGATSDAFIAMYDRNGDIGTNSSAVSWVALIAGSGTTNDKAYSVACTPDGEDGVNVFVCGTFVTSTTLYSAAGNNTPSITLTAPSGNTDGFIAKYDKNGVLKWAYDIGGTGSGTDIAYDVCAHGTVVWVCGSYVTSTIFSHSGSPVTFTMTGSQENAILTKYTDNGTSATYQWTRGLGSNSIDAYYATACDDNYNCLVTGIIRAGATIQTNGSGGTQSVTNSGNYEIVAALYNTSGTMSWVRNYGSSSFGTNVEAATAAAMDVNGDCYIGGYYSGVNPVFCSTLSSTTIGDWSSFVMKILANGTCSWVQTGNSTVAGNYDIVNSIAVDNCAQRVYATGNYKGAWGFGTESLNPVNSTTPNLDGFVAVMDASTGSTSGFTASRLGGYSNDDNCKAISVNSVEDIFIAGAFSSINWETSLNTDVAGTYDSYLARLDYSAWPSTASSGTTVNQGINVVDCNVYTTGIMSSNSVSFSPQPVISARQANNGVYSDDIYFTAIDKYADGYDVSAALTSGRGDERSYDMANDGNGNYYIAGTAVTSTNGPDIIFNSLGASGTYTVSGTTTSAFICKTNASGTNQWVDFVRSSTTNTVVGIGTTVDGSGNIYLCGYLTGTGTFTDQTGTAYTLTSSGGYDIFVIKLNSSGNLIWKQVFGSASGTDYATAICVDLTSSYYYITGEFTGTIVLGQTLASTGSGDGYVMRGNTGTGAAICSMKYGGTGNDFFNDIFVNNTAEVYACGIKAGNACVASFNLTSSTTPSQNWSTVATGSTTGYGNAIALGDDGYLFVAGYATAAQTFYPSTVVGPGAFVVKIASWSAGAYSQSTYTATSCNELAIDHGAGAFDTGNNEYICGGAGATPLAYIDKVSADGSAQSQRHANPHAATEETTSTTSTSTVYPNPLSASAIIELDPAFDLSTAPATIIITDMTGREVRRMEGVTSNRMEIDGSDLSNGIYMYQIVQSGTVISNGKMMVQH